MYATNPSEGKGKSVLTVPDLDLGGPEALVQGGPHNSRNSMPF